MAWPAIAACIMAWSLQLQAQGFSLNSDKGLRYLSEGGNVDLRMGGRLHLDGGLFFEDENRMENDWRWRRVRLSLRLDLYDDWRFSLQYDPEDEEERYSSLWLRYRGFNKTNVTLGQFEEPFGLETSTSSNAIMFMERSLPAVLTPGTHVGIELTRWGEDWTQALGAFWETYIEDDKPLDVSEGRGVSGRVTFASMKNKEALWHVGASASLRWPDERDRVRFRSRPETRVTDVRLINSGRIRHVDRYLMTGLEAATVSGSFSLQGEYMRTWIERQKGEGDHESVHGAYLAASWIVTGERRRYNKGSFQIVRPVERHAWELALRFSYLDLNGNDLDGGREEDITLGVNAYLSDAVRLMLNHIWVDTDARAGDLDPRIVQMRIQVAI